MADDSSSSNHSGFIVNDLSEFTAENEDEEISKEALAEIANDEALISNVSPPSGEECKPKVPARTSSKPRAKEEAEGADHLEIEELQTVYNDIVKDKIFQLAGDDLCGRPVIAFSSCRLPPRTDIDHQKLLAFIKSLLDQYVENDYTLVYFHYGLNRANKPSMKWLLQIYQELDRKYKKNLKALFIVHPSNFIKIVFKVLYPFISKKFGKKINYVNRLNELGSHFRLDQLDIPDIVKEHDKQLSAVASTSIFHTKLDEPEPLEFGVSLKFIRERSGEPIPISVQSSIEFIVDNALDVEGIFRRSTQANLLNETVRKFNAGDKVTFSAEQVHLAPAVLKKFLRDLPEPLLTFELNDKIGESCSLHEDAQLSFTKKILNDILPEDNRLVLIYLLQFLQKVIDHSSKNRMNAGSLAIVFGPNLLWSQSETATLASMSKINTFTKYLIENYNLLFDESSA